MQHHHLLVILRGAPGAGKTTFAMSMMAAFGAKAAAISADDWFALRNGGVFDPSKLKDAHDWCRQETFALLEAGHTVFLHNTSTTEWEVAPYIDFCQWKGIKFASLIAENRHEGKNVHGVPEHKVELMRQKLRANMKL